MIDKGNFYQWYQDGMYESMTRAWKEEKVSGTLTCREDGIKVACGGGESNLVKDLKIRKLTQKHTKSECMNFAYNEVKNRYGWTDKDWDNLVKLWNRESGWNASAVNKRSGACGIPQALPCSKMKSRGSDYKTNCYTQINWGLGYIASRYGSPTKAWNHSQKKGWY